MTDDELHNLTVARAVAIRNEITGFRLVGLTPEEEAAMPEFRVWHEKRAASAGAQFAMDVSRVAMMSSCTDRPRDPEVRAQSINSSFIRKELAIFLTETGRTRLALTWIIARAAFIEVILETRTAVAGEAGGSPS